METAGKGPKDVSKKIQEDRELLVNALRIRVRDSMDAADAVIRIVNEEARKYPGERQKSIYENGSSADVLELRASLLKLMKLNKDLLPLFEKCLKALGDLKKAVTLAGGANEKTRTEDVDMNIKHINERIEESNRDIVSQQELIGMLLKRMAENKRKETETEEERKKAEAEAEAARVEAERPYLDMPKLMTGTPAEEKEALESDRLVGKGKRSRDDESGVSSEIKKAMEYALSGEDMMEALGNCPLIKYPDIDKYDTPEALFNGSKIAVVLFLTVSEQMGHWLGLIDHKTHYEVFDSFGVSHFVVYMHQFLRFIYLTI